MNSTTILRTLKWKTCSKGSWFTWSNKRGGEGYNKSKLDRVLINSSWLTIFAHTEAWTLPPGISVHCSLVVTVLPPIVRPYPLDFLIFG